MKEEVINGSCLCGTVRFKVTPPFAGFRYCYCSRCRKATGSAHAANLFAPAAQFAWLAGEEHVSHFDLPGAKRFSVSFCNQCGSRVPHQIRGREDVLVPAGSLDSDPAIRPGESIFWGSKVAWYVAPETIPKRNEYS